MALLPSSTPGAAGAAVVYTQVTASDTFVNSGRTLLHVKNPDVSNALTVTVSNDPAYVASQDAPGYLSKVFTVPANTDRILPALNLARFGSTVTVGFTKTGGITSVTAAVIEQS